MSLPKPAGQRPRPTVLRGLVRIPAPEEPVGWAARSLCADTDPDRLFVTGAAQRKAVAVCRRCPVMDECAAEALDNRVQFGIWGGMTERQRRALLNHHPEVVSWSNFLAERQNRSAG